MITNKFLQENTGLVSRRGCGGKQIFFRTFLGSIDVDIHTFYSCFRLVLLFMMIYSVFWARSAILVGKIQQEWGKLEKVGDITYYLPTSLQPSRRENMKTRQYLANKLSFSFAFNMNFLPWETKLPPIPSLVMTLPISYKNTVTDLLERVLFKTCVN